MKTALSRKAAYMGTGGGLVLFAVFGLLPGCLLGGAAGVKFAGMLFGLPLGPGLLTKGIVLVFMLIGLTVSGIVIVTAMSTAAWLVGSLVDSQLPAQLRTAPEKMHIAHR